MDPPEKARETQQKLKTPFPLLSDSKQDVMETYGTRSLAYHGPRNSTINTPTLVLIDRAGTVRWIHQAADYKVRAPISEVLAEAQKLKNSQRLKVESSK